MSGLVTFKAPFDSVKDNTVCKDPFSKKLKVSPGLYGQVKPLIRLVLFSFIDLTFLRIMLPNDYIISQYATISLRLPPLKNVISENIVSDVQLKNSISWKSYAHLLRYSVFCISNYSINCKVCNAMGSISTLEGTHFVTCLL